jgi:acyl carrier protein
MSGKQSLIFSQEDIEAQVIAVLENMTADWELEDGGKIDTETRLMEDLAFESFDVVQLVVALEKNFERKGLPFEQLFMREGDYVDELEVKEIVEFLHKNLQ